MTQNNLPVIITEKYDGHYAEQNHYWIARIEGQKWHEAGRTEAEAIGKLHISHQNVFGKIKSPYQKGR